MIKVEDRELVIDGNAVYELDNVCLKSLKFNKEASFREDELAKLILMLVVVKKNGLLN